jgi:hypothetical protein
LGVCTSGVTDPIVCQQSTTIRSIRRTKHHNNFALLVYFFLVAVVFLGRDTVFFLVVVDTFLVAVGFFLIVTFLETVFLTVFAGMVAAAFLQ